MTPRDDIDLPQSLVAAAAATPEILIRPAPGRRGVRELLTAVLVRAPRPRVFEFFSQAQNLELLTPPWLKFAIKSEIPVEMSAGVELTYALRIRGIPFRWKTLISAFDPPEQFVDVQTQGPYRVWEHHHRFYDADGGTLMSDRVDFSARGGALVSRLLIEPDLRRIFQFRHEAIRTRFAGS